MKTNMLIFTLALGASTCLLNAQESPPQGSFTIAQTISDFAQQTTLAFDGLAMITGNMDAQSFFPPGKVADYTGFQYLRDNDPDNMGHNTSFLTRIANNVIYILNDSQFAQLVTLATNQQEQVNLYGYKRFPLMKAFRRLIAGEIPAGSTGLNLNAVKQTSHELYLIDGQISFDRALLYANIYRSMNDSQTAYLDAMKGQGFNSWPDITGDLINSKMQRLPQGAAVAVMTYASDLFSWYAGSVDADVYFCPERQGTYYGGFYIKDAPAVGHEGYSINEQLTATAGAALCDSSQQYVTQDQASLMSSLVDIQRNNLYAGATNIVQTRTQIATLLRSLLISTASTNEVKTQVLALSGIYGDLDGENNYNYATVFAQVYNTLTSVQKNNLAALRKFIMSGTYADGTTFDYSVCATPFLYSDVITNATVLAPYIDNTDYLFLDGGATSPTTASVSLSQLVQTYDGTAKPVGVTTVPANLPVSVTYNGAANAPTNAGSYKVVATISNPNYFGSTTNMLVVNKAAAGVSLANLTQTYNGTAKRVTASTTPASLTVVITYNGAANAPTNAGSYKVVATINNPNYFGSTTNTLVVNKATAGVGLGNLTQTYDGMAKRVTASTTPANLTVVITYNGTANAPTNAGSYKVVATISNPNYFGSATNTLVVNKATAGVGLANLTQTYDGTAKRVTASTTPANLIVAITYNGSTSVPTKTGSYKVIGTIVNANYQGSATNTLTIKTPVGGKPSMASNGSRVSSATLTPLISSVD